MEETERHERVTRWGMLHLISWFPTGLLLIVAFVAGDAFSVTTNFQYWSRGTITIWVIAMHICGIATAVTGIMTRQAEHPRCGLVPWTWQQLVILSTVIVTVVWCLISPVFIN